jgi:hypothetical protein
MLDFAEQLKEYLDIVEDLQLEVKERPSGRTWKWLKFWRQKDRGVDGLDAYDSGKRMTSLWIHRLIFW